MDPLAASKLVMEQLAQKGAPAGMTAMLATLAATATSASGLSEQKRLLMELEKKVEEQKKLIEMQKVNGHFFFFQFCRPTHNTKNLFYRLKLTKSKSRLCHAGEAGS